MSEKLSPAAIDAALNDLLEWQRVDGREAITRQFRFPSFVKAFAFMTASALEAEKLNHHPEWSNTYGLVDVVLTTHSTDGITEFDIKLAKKMNALA